VHARATALTSLALAVVGVLMVVRTIAGGGGPLSLGVLLGVLFVAAGAGRLHVARERSGRVG
jgi:hypothetical protein